MTFDLWMNYNGGVGGATGSTEFVEVGAHSNAQQAEYPGGTGTGFFFMWSGEGGAAQDARYYENPAAAAQVRDDARPNWHGANQIDYLGSGWTTLFPSPAYQTAGAPGKAWTKMELQIRGAQVAVFATPQGGTRTQIANWATGTGVATTGYPMVGYNDAPFTGVAIPAADNFAIIDNLKLAEFPNAVEDFQLYQ